MPPRVGLVTCDARQPGVDRDTEIHALVAVLNDAGLQADAPIWSAPADWERYDMLVIKSPWDYSLRSAEFLAWLRAVSAHVPVRNHPGIIEWNIDKTYLHELVARGVAVPEFHLATTPAAATAAARELGSEHVVVKPTVSAGSKNTGLFHRDDPALAHLVARIKALGKVAMVQRALPSVADDGEHALIMFNGRFSHAARKGPILEAGGGLRGGRYTEAITPAAPQPDEIELAERCMEAARRLAIGRGIPAEHATPLAARIDIARDDDGRPTILEAELFEPNYFTPTAPGAAGRFAAAVREQLDALTGARPAPR